MGIRYSLSLYREIYDFKIHSFLDLILKETGILLNLIWLLFIEEMQSKDRQANFNFISIKLVGFILSLNNSKIRKFD